MIDLFTGNEDNKKVVLKSQQTEINFLAGETFTKYSDLSANAKEIEVNPLK